MASLDFDRTPVETGDMCSSSTLSLADQPRLDVPRRGYVLTTIAEKYGSPIRKAVSILSTSLAKRDCSELREIFVSSGANRHYLEASRTDAELVAWSVISIWIVSVSVRSISPAKTSLKDAQKWFFGDELPEQLMDSLPEEAIRFAEKLLQTNADADIYYELLPYILDPHGPGSRLSVKRDPGTDVARKRKRTEGVFYTPADVAEYMVCGCLDSFYDNCAPTVLDPACGTGVFLRAALREMLRRYPREKAFSLVSDKLFGIDIDPWPLDASAYVLLCDILRNEVRTQKTPVFLWRGVRSNFSCIDALQLDIVGESKKISSRTQLSEIFPALKERPRVVVGNPPYAKLGDRTDIEELKKEFKTLAAKPKPSAEIYLAFLEQMVRLADDQDGAGALVLPLSIACNVGPQYVAARKLIQETGGQWRFAFFDREPHALFGEDVKTRNSILIWAKNKSESKLVTATSPLQKWRGSGRAQMFKGIRFTEIEGSIQAGIPKIDGSHQANALKVLDKRWHRLSHAIHDSSRISLDSIRTADDQTVFVGPTAYNFLNVFLKPSSEIFDEKWAFSEHPLHAINCSSEDDALRVFSILTSHLAYWWWHTHGDGFHVSKRFISDFPFGLEVFSGEAANSLRDNGAILWSAIKDNPIVSSNRGKTSLAYSPNGHDNMRRNADEALARVAGISCSFVDELQQFTAHAVAAKPRINITRKNQDNT